MGPRGQHASKATLKATPEGGGSSPARGIALLNRPISPVNASASITAPVTMPAAMICDSVRPSSMATAAIAFIGCIGSGTRKTSPVVTFATPDPTSAGLN